MVDQDYERAGEILKAAIEQMFSVGVPKEDIAPLLADFATMFAFVGGRATGVLAILLRMSEYADELETEHAPDPSVQEPQRQDARNAAFLLQSLKAAQPEGQSNRFSLTRRAMESMTQLQGMSLEEACGCMVYYTLGLLIQEHGIQKGETLVRFAQDELARFQAEST